MFVSLSFNSYMCVLSEEEIKTRERGLFFFFNIYLPLAHALSCVALIIHICHCIINIWHILHWLTIRTLYFTLSSLLQESPTVTAINETVIPFLPVQLPHPPWTTTLFNPRRRCHVSGLESLPHSWWTMLFWLVLTCNKLNRKNYYL